MNRSALLRLASLVVVSATLCACAAPPPPAPVAARLTVPSPGCLEQLAQFAGQVTGRKVTLGSPGSFADTDQLVLERPGPRGPDGRSAEAEVFQLQQVPGGVCTVLHVKSGARAPLAACMCAPKTP